ncbi:MAG: iron-sulfur cluster repair di-iron protein [Crocinitomicaceae bacterium]|nr:iron-sulfur cluster repair di-iron protein [Crocinitomicaceae bacterium]
MDLDNTTTVAEIVSQNVLTADVFKKNGIDFCCNGNVSLKDVCHKKGISFNKVTKQIEELKLKSKVEYAYDKLDLDDLIDHIENKHHNYVEEATQLIIQYADKVAKVHGHCYTEVVKVNQIFHELASELAGHMKKEELILFPYIKNLAEAKRVNMQINPPRFGTSQNPIRNMEYEHDLAGHKMRQIQEITKNFEPPAEACNTFKALYAKLKEFQEDLFLHIHLENNILFPKAIALEQELMINK